MNIQDIASASALIKQELAPLTEKIGQGAEFTYGLFKRQVYVNAFTSLLLIIPGIMFLFFSRILWIRAEKMRKEDRYSHHEMVYLSAGISLIVGFSMILAPISGLISVLVYPDYQAIKLILETVRG